MPAPIVIRTRVTLDLQPMVDTIQQKNRTFFPQVEGVAAGATKLLRRAVNAGTIADSPYTTKSGRLHYRPRPSPSPTGWTDAGTPTLYTHANTGNLLRGVQVEKESRGVGQYAGGHTGGVSFRIRLPEAAPYFIFHESMAPRTRIPYRPTAAPVAEWARIELMRLASKHYGVPMGVLGSAAHPTFRPVERPPGQWDSLQPIGMGYTPVGPTGLWTHNIGAGI